MCNSCRILTAAILSVLLFSCKNDSPVSPPPSILKTGDTTIASEKSRSVTPPPVKMELTPEAAKQAIVEYIKMNPDEFSSPGAKETAENIEKEIISPVESGKMFFIGRFSVDMDNQSYGLMHMYGKPGGGWFEHWVWEGKFIQTKDGSWTLTKPNFLKKLGKR
jgi:hypothetical protein